MNYPSLLLKRALATLAVSLLLAGAVAAQPAGAPKKSYNLAAGDAATTLKAFSEQSGEQIVYPADKVSGVQTKAVSGELTAREALTRMLAGSGLIVVQDEKTGAYALQSLNAQPAAEKNVPSRREVDATATANAPTAAGDVVQLSPFEVNGAQDRGYLATTAMSGTRLNSKIEDIASALSVVTKQQLQDTAAVDINDVFLYEANTEGSGQWTSYTIDRGTVSDDIEMNPYGVTRMRGLSAANTATDGFSSSLPFDTYNVDSIEVSRGPNSSVFGLGNTGGGVNINSSKANVTHDITSFGTRGDSYGGYRENFDFNRVLLKNKFALRVLGLYDSKGFERKPSSEITRRLDVELAVRPFKNTKITAGFESYRDAYNRPNSTTPRDGISDWIANGKPTWDPLTSTVHFGNGSPAITLASTSAAESSLLPYGIAPYDSNFTTYPSMYIQNRQIQLYEINEMPAATGIGPNSAPTTGTLPAHLLTSGTFYNRYTTQYPLFVTAGVTNKSIYDWTSVNITAPNYGKTKGETSNVNFEQNLLNTPRQQLTLQASWQGERVATDNRSFLGTYGNAGGKLQVSIDINEKLLDGSPNPYFLQPYLGYPRPQFSKPLSNIDRYRSTLAYQLNLTKERGWLKYFGRHNLTAYSEYNAYFTRSFGFTDTISSDQPWMTATGGPANVPSSRNTAPYRFFAHYLLGDANGYNVDYGAPGLPEPPAYSATLRYYNAVTKQWVNEPENFAEYYFANRPNRRLLSTYGGTWQGSFLDDRIVTTFGARRDSNRNHDANSASQPTTATDGYLTINQSPTVYGANDWVQSRGTTKTAGVVVKPLSWLHLLYNQSDSFTPGALGYDVNGLPLPDPKGKGKDYGFQLVLFDSRLTIRAQQYEDLDSSRGDSTINTYIQRTLRMDASNIAPTTYPITSSDPNLAAWYGNELQLKNPTWTSDQITAQVIKDTGIDPTFIAGHYGKVHGDHSSATSRGKEIEITYNPTRFWTIKATATQTLAFNGQLSGEVQDYINARMPIWTTIKGPYTGATWWTTTIGGSTPLSFYTANVAAPIALLVATQGKQKTQTREYNFRGLTNYKLAGLTENKWLRNLDVGAAIRWAGKAEVGYYGSPPDSTGIINNYDPNRPIWDKARYSIDLSAGYNLRLFSDKVRARLQLNVKDIFERGRLQAVGYNPDGTPFAFRIVDPRQFILSANFDL